MKPLEQNPQAPQPTREEFINSLFALQPKDNYKQGKEAVNSLVEGVKKGYNAIKGSYGSAGGNAVIKAFDKF